MTLTKKSLLLATILLALACATAARAQGKSKASLLISYMKGDGGDVQHVERLDFVNGDLVARRRIATFHPFTDGYVVGVARGHYVVTGRGEKAFDLHEGRFVNGLPAREASKKVELPGLVSPDGAKSVYAGGRFAANTDSLELHFVGSPTVFAREHFEATVRSVASQRPVLPLLWTDDDRILTQRSNGNLVIVSTDGAVSPFLQLPCTADDYTYLERNRSGKLVYICDGQPYFLDVENRRYERIKRDLGNGFALDFVNGEDVYYFSDAEIGRDGFHPSATKSYLALEDSRTKEKFVDSASIKSVKVWSEAKRAWTRFTFNGRGAQIVGWMEE